MLFSLPTTVWQNAMRIVEAQTRQTDQLGQNFVLQFKFNPKNRLNKVLAAWMF